LAQLTGLAGTPVALAARDVLTLSLTGALGA
jgi:hypothetical protein